MEPVHRPNDFEISVHDQPAHEHIPVLVDAVLHWLAPQPGLTIFDGTLGLAGHALAILPRIMPGGRYLGLDLDPTMAACGQQRLTAAGYAPTMGVHCFQGNYADFSEKLNELGWPGVDRMLLDLGVNSAQLSEAARGFSFDRDGPLDMRYDSNQQRKALDLVNGLSESDLADLFWEFGQEGQSRKIAKKICQVRHSARINSTLALARAVESALHSEGGGKTHPATRVFQALRIAVNRELDNLKLFLERAAEFLRPGGRLVVISFHSLEDALVKHFLRDSGKAGTMEELTDRPVVAEPPERHANPRSRSAKLRAAQRL